MSPEVKKAYKTFLLQVVLSGIVVFAIFASIRYFSDTWASYPEIVTGWLICTLNVSAGAYFIALGLGKSNQLFLSLVFGSMFIRVLIILGFVLTGVLWIGFETMPFVISLFSYYFIFLIFELLFLFKITKRRVK